MKTKYIFTLLFLGISKVVFAYPDYIKNDDDKLLYDKAVYFYNKALKEDKCLFEENPLLSSRQDFVNILVDLNKCLEDPLAYNLSRLDDFVTKGNYDKSDVIRKAICIHLKSDIGISKCNEDPISFVEYYKRTGLECDPDYQAKDALWTKYNWDEITMQSYNQFDHLDKSSPLFDNSKKSITYVFFGIKNGEERVALVRMDLNCNILTIVEEGK